MINLINIADATGICPLQRFPMMVLGYKVAAKTYTLGATVYTLAPNVYTLGATGYTLGANVYPAGANVYTLGANVYPAGANVYTLGATGYPIMTIVNRKMVIGIEESQENIVSQIN